jgi:hypothetical protein
MAAFGLGDKVAIKNFYGAGSLIEKKKHGFFVLNNSVLSFTGIEVYNIQE